MANESVDPNNEARGVNGRRLGKPMPSVSNYEHFEMHELYGVDDQAYLMAQIDRNYDLSDE